MGAAGDVNDRRCIGLIVLMIRQKLAQTTEWCNSVVLSQRTPPGLADAQSAPRAG